ncbi:VirB3 family type IV secretion system protein [Acidovorax sp. CCYZU-2555]|uniref:VirB3 family type IV secretion system protein n=1 Tax=Acidovorax sp. CCYZU-2555 TaxID=2835042 RepID=UPI001BCCD248|nr:VirB3 family type IV secretion system protein [Acidovorax sp. CCYZU-2555]MBS7776866.1 VirB3 family type IV secretion system protein [Acidovorax sp. CCYZU-2555]
MMAADLFHDDGDALVAAMTRPTMVGGLTLTSIAVSVYCPGMIALITRSLWAAALIPVFLLISYLVCLKDVYLFDIAAAAFHLKTCPNRRLWRCRRYAPH